MAVLTLREALLEARKPVIGKAFVVRCDLGDGPRYYRGVVVGPIGADLWHVRCGGGPAACHGGTQDACVSVHDFCRPTQ